MRAIVFSNAPRPGLRPRGHPDVRPPAPRPRRLLLPAALVVLLVLLAGPAARSATLSAAVDRNVIPLGETFTLSLTYDGVASADPPVLPTLPNLVQAAGTSQRSEMSFVNGRQSLKVVFDYRLAPRQAGDILIPPIQGRAGGAVLTSQPVQVKVLPPSAAALAAQQQQILTRSNRAFVRLVVPRNEVYVGEPLPVELHLYFTGPVRDAHLPELQPEGFSLGPSPPHAESQTVIGNVPYRLVVRRIAATPARAGRLTLGPATSRLTLLEETDPRRPRGFFDFGPSYQSIPVTLASEPVPIQVLPLPTENVPPGFNGAIGSYRLNFEAGPTNLTVGDPVTLRLAITGNGPVESLAFPTQSDWRDFNTYPPTSKVELSDPLGLGGTKRFEQVVIPENHEIKALPPLRFSFFDPQARAYRTLASAAIPLAIRPAATASAPPPGLTNAAAAGAPAADEIVHIRPRLDLVRPAPALVLGQPWFLGLQALPLAAWLVLLARRKRAESLANNPRLRRQREVAGRVRDGLRDLRAHAQAQASAEFFATLFRVLQEQLGERLDLPASAITEAVVDERLRPRGLDEQALRELHDLFQACNAARYAPVASAQELAALIPRVEAALARLREVQP